MIGRLLSWIGERLRSIRYLLGDLLFVITRPLRALGRRAAEGWESLPPVTRRRIGAAAGVVAVGALLALVVWPNLPCSFPGGDECAPGDEAIDIVPAGSLAYVHANLDPETEQYAQALAIAARTPRVTGELAGRVLTQFIGAPGTRSDFGQDIQPWFGGEVGLAQVPGESGAEQIQLLEADDGDGAREYTERIAKGELTSTEHEGVEVREDEGGLASALVDGFLVLGSGSGVRSVIDVATGAEGSEALAGDEVASDALDALPESRLAEVYLSAEGIDSYLEPANGPLSPLEPFVDSAASQGAALSLSGEADGFALASRSVLDPERSEGSSGFFSAFEDFDPELPAELAPDTLAYFGLGQASETVDTLVAQATVRAPGIASGFSELIERLRTAAGVDISKDLLPALGGEGAFAVVPRPEAPEEDLAAPPAGGSVPYLEFLAADVDEEAALEALARLQGPLAEAVDPSLGGTGFEQDAIGDVTAQILRLPAGAEFAYAAADDQLVVANDTAPIGRLGTDEAGLAGTEAYQAATDGLREEPAFITYLDLAGLLSYAERSGLAQDTAYGAFATDLRLLRTFALTVETDEDELATDARLRISEP